MNCCGTDLGGATVGYGSQYYRQRNALVKATALRPGFGDIGRATGRMRTMRNMA